MDIQQIKESIQLIRKESPDITFCLFTNGLMLPFMAEMVLKAQRPLRKY